MHPPVPPQERGFGVQAVTCWADRIGISFSGLSSCAHFLDSKSTQVMAGPWSRLMVRPTSSSQAGPRSLTTSRETPGRSPGLFYTGVSTRRVLKRMFPRSAPKERKNFSVPLLEPHFRTSWPRGTRSPKCVRLSVSKLFVLPRRQRRPQPNLQQPKRLHLLLLKHRRLSRRQPRTSSHQLPVLAENVKIC